MIYKIVQAPSVSAGYRPNVLMPRRLVGLGQVLEATGDCGGCARPIPTSGREMTMAEIAKRKGIKPVVANAGRRVVPMVGRKIVPMAHPDTPAYEWGGGLPTLFDDPTAVHSTLTPLQKLSWFWKKAQDQHGISAQRAGGKIGPVKPRYATWRNTPFFAATYDLPTQEWKLPTWPNRPAPFLAGVAPVFRVVQQSNEERQSAPVWPHIPIAQYGDVPVGMSRFLRVTPNAMASETYPLVRQRYWTPQIRQNPYLVHPRASVYLPGTVPGLQEKSGMGRGR